MSGLGKYADIGNAGHRPELERLFGSIAGVYNPTNHILSMGLDVHWRNVLVKSLANVPAGVFLDLATGSFEAALPLTRAYPERKILALDPCLKMLEHGLVRCGAGCDKNCLPESVVPVAADAFHLPLADNSVAAVSVSFGLRNMLPRVKALAEMFRVLKPGGRLSVLEFGSGKLKAWFGLYNFYMARIMPRLAGIFTGQRGAYEYLAHSITSFPVAAELAREMGAAGFTTLSYKRLSGGIVYLHCADKAPLEAATSKTFYLRQPGCAL